FEDHAFRAHLAALDIQRETERLAAEVRHRDGVTLQMRVGVNSGQVIAGEIGSGPRGYRAIGEQVGMAQRMESAAPPGGVMLSATISRDGAASHAWSAAPGKSAPSPRFSRKPSAAPGVVEGRRDRSAGGGKPALLTMDGAKHSNQRSVMSKAFTPGA